MKPERIAILGAGGFLGSHLVATLLARGARAIDAVDVDFRKLEVKDARVHRIAARVEDPRVVEEVVGRCDVVLSLTALCNPALYNTEPLAVIDASFSHLVPMVASVAGKHKRLIHFSTCEVYGRAALDAEGNPAETMNEESTGSFLGPVHRERWTYACAKQLLERVIWAYGRHHGLDFTIVRPFNVIGARMDFLPGVDGDGVPRVLASFMNALLRGEELLLVDGGRQRRSFISVEDFTEAIVRIVERPAVCRGEILNIGNPDNDVTIRELAEALGAAFASCVEGSAPLRLAEITGEELYGSGYDDCSVRIPEIGKARRLLGWEPRTPLAAMLPGIVRDYAVRYRAVLRGGRAIELARAGAR
jgi:UDP-apiose/xylose synthase